MYFQVVPINGRTRGPGISANGFTNGVDAAAAVLLRRRINDPVALAIFKIEITVLTSVK